MYQDLLEMERKLDWTMMRKKVEIQDALARNPTVRRHLELQCLTRLEVIATSCCRQAEPCEYSSATLFLGSYGRLEGMSVPILRRARESLHGRSKLRDGYSRYATCALSVNTAYNLIIATQPKNARQSTSA